MRSYKTGMVIANLGDSIIAVANEKEPARPLIFSRASSV
jgi:hypothetical protein